MMRLAIILSHPIQYYSPWFCQLSQTPELLPKVFYLWDSGINKKRDQKLMTEFAWDIPLLDGYENTVLKNVSSDPGTHHSGGLDCPTLIDEVVDWQPDAILLFGYAWKAHREVIMSTRLVKIPLIYRGDSHQLHHEGGCRNFFKSMAKWILLKRFSHFLTVGQANVDALLKLGINKDQMTTAFHCVDNSRFQHNIEKTLNLATHWKTKTLGIASDRPIILFVGKFEPKKRPLDLLEAFLKLPQTDPPPALVFVGSGQLDGTLKMRSGRSLGENVFFAGFQNQSEMPRAYASGTVLVLPSYGNGETWGLAVNEAMNLGLPAIVSSHVGCGLDLVIPGETGWQFPAGDVGALSNALLEALDNLPATKFMGENARKRVNDYFSYDAATDATIRALKKVPALASKF